MDVRPSETSRPVPFLPEELLVFLKRRLREIAGTCLFLCGLALIVALFGYDPADPSWNHAVGRDAENPLGYGGASIAAILVPAVGIAAIVPGLALMAWGLRIGCQQPLGHVWIRIAMVPPAILALSVTVAGIQEPWTLSAGRTGPVLHADLMDVLANFGVSQAWLASVLAGLLTCLAGAVIFGLPRLSLNWMGRGFASMGMACARSIVRVFLQRYRSVNAREAMRVGEPVPVRGGLAQGAGPVVEVAEPAPAPLQEPVPVEDSHPRPVEPVAPKPRPRKRIMEACLPRDEPPREDFLPGLFTLPPLELLDPPPGDGGSNQQDESALAENAQRLEQVLKEFNVRGRIVKVRPGPVVTLYELEPGAGTKSARVIALADDVARSMSVMAVRIAVVPGKNVIGIELPNVNRELVVLRELLQTREYRRHGGALSLVLGRDIGGEPVVEDLARMPHLLIAGTTGSGKSVAVNTMIMSLLYRRTPDECKFIMIDPKMLELSVYDNIPHLLTPVVTDPAKAVVALRWAVREMENRYRAMSMMGVRNIQGYNQRLSAALEKGETLVRQVQTGFDPETGEPVYEEQQLDLDRLPHIVVIVDEMADLMLVAGKEVEAAVQRLAQMARAAGIHLIMATQRPSVDVITGTIKANFPTRVSFQVTSKIDSRTILGDSGGAEQLLGQGDMLYMAGGGRLRRVHGPFASDEAVERVVEYLRSQRRPDYIADITEGEHVSPFIPSSSETGAGGETTGDDSLYDQAVAIVCRERKASTSFVQRQLQIGYNRAARIIERMEAEGVISKANHVGKREVLAGHIEDHET